LGSTTHSKFLGQLEHYELVKKYGAPFTYGPTAVCVLFGWMKSSNVDYRRQRKREWESTELQ
jgi:hypothetical protein